MNSTHYNEYSQYDYNNYCLEKKIGDGFYIRGSPGSKKKNSKDVDIDLCVIHKLYKRLNY